MLLWILYCSLEGVSQGALFSHNSENCNARYPFNIHLFLLPPRAIAWIAISGMGWALLANFLMFSFFHNGCFYETRRKLEPKNEKLSHYRFSSKSKTTTAKINIRFEHRILGLIGGIIIHFLIETSII